MTIERLVVPRRQVRDYGDWSGAVAMMDDPRSELITLTPDTVSIRQTEKVVGKNKYSGKEYVNYRHTQSFYFSWKAGPLRVFHKQSGGIAQNRRTTMRDVTATGIWGENDLLEAIRPFILERIPSYDGGQGLVDIWQHHAYPLINETNWKPAIGIAPHMRAHTIQDFTRSAFGKRGYRKDLVKFLARQSNIEPVILTYALRNLVPIEWLMNDSFRDHPVRYTHLGIDTTLKEMPKLFKMLDMNERKRLLNDLHSANWMHVQDTLRYVRLNMQQNPGWTLVDHRVTTWDDLHTHLPREARRIQSANVEIHQTKIAKALDNVEFGEYRLVSAKDTHELMDWGNYMSNCIGGYGGSAVIGNCTLIALMRGNEMIANIGIVNNGGIQGHIRQLYGKYNARLDDALDAEVRKQINRNVNAAHVKKLGLK